MLAVFATLAFLVALWLCTTLIAATLEQSGSKIIAALQDRTLLASPSVPPIEVRLSQRYASLASRPMRARAGLRAAA